MNDLEALEICEVFDSDATKRSEYNDEIERIYGKEAKEAMVRLWNNGCLFINSMGYVNISSRGYDYIKTGTLPPRRKPKLKPTTFQYLDYLWSHNQADFEKWLDSKGYVRKKR